MWWAVLAALVAGVSLIYYGLVVVEGRLDSGARDGAAPTILGLVVLVGALVGALVLI